ncbi:MAG: hypothetical protein Q9205_001783 [Flavoplaca limonia]
MLLLIRVSESLNLPLPIASSPNIPAPLNATAHAPLLWPKVPWKLTGLLKGGVVRFEDYGRRLSLDTETKRQIHEGAGRIAQALTFSFHPGSEAQGLWPYNRGAVSFLIALDPKNPATRAEVLDLFDWTLALMRRFSHAPEEITRGILFDAHGSGKACFSLTFPGIPEDSPHERELPGNWPRAPWTFAIAEGFIEFEYYGRRLRDPTRVITTQIERSLVQIKSSILQTFEPSGEDTWTCRRGVANFVVHLEPDNPATGLEIYNLFCWMHYLIRRWDDTSVEIGGAVLFLRGKVRAYCSLTLPGVVTVYGHQDQIEGKAIERR